MDNFYMKFRNKIVIFIIVLEAGGGPSRCDRPHMDVVGSVTDQQVPLLKSRPFKINGCCPH